MSTPFLDLIEGSSTVFARNDRVSAPTGGSQIENSTPAKNPARMKGSRYPGVPAARRREHLRQLRDRKRLQHQERATEQVRPRRHVPRVGHDEHQTRENIEQRRNRRD